MPFNKDEHLIELKSKTGAITKYLPVQWRLVWANEEQQKIKITILHHFVDPNQVIEKGKWDKDKREYIPVPVKGFAYFLVRVEDDWGKVGEAPGSESAADFDDYIEKAHTKAVGRALALIGYGTQFAGPELDEEHRIVDAPVDTSSIAPTKPGAAVAQASKPTPTPIPTAKPAASPVVKPAEVPLDIEALLERMEKELGTFERKRFLTEIGLDPEIDLRTGYAWNKVSYAMIRDGFNIWIESDKREQWLNAPAETKHMLYILSSSTGIIAELIKRCGGKEQGIQTLNAIRDADKDMVGLKFKDNPAFTGRLADRYIGYYKRGHLTETGQFLVDVPEEFQYKKLAA